MDRASNRLTPNTHVSITPAGGHHYAQLRIGKSKITLGRYDRSDPVGLLAVILGAVDRLTEYELVNLLRCDKSQREPNRRPGRQRKYRR